MCHDGVFSTLNQWSTEELFFPLHDFGGPLWEKREVYEKWDPATRLKNWSTPQLVIHNELDYRLPISEGLAMFNVLQARGVPSRFLMFPDENHVGALSDHHPLTYQLTVFLVGAEARELSCVAQGGPWMGQQILRGGGFVESKWSVSGMKPSFQLTCIL